VIRRQAGLDVRRFCALAGIPTTTWYRQRKRALGGRPAKGPWPRPVATDRVVAVVHAYALRYPAWGHRKIWALTVADGHTVSQRTVHRILDERGLLNGRRYQAERRELAKARRATFHAPPTRRNRVWQTDFSQFETRAGGTWQLGGVVDYAAKFCLTCPVTATKTWREAVAALEAARERAGELLGAPLIADLVDRDTGELHPIRVVTDNGPCYKAGAFARYIPLAARVRARPHPPPLAREQRRDRALVRVGQVRAPVSPRDRRRPRARRARRRLRADLQRRAAARDDRLGATARPLHPGPQPRQVTTATHRQRPDPSQFLDTGHHDHPRSRTSHKSGLEERPSQRANTNR
jgi:putative transposase